MPQTQNGLEQGLKLTNPSEFSVSMSLMMLRQAKPQITSNHSIKFALFAIYFRSVPKFCKKESRESNKNIQM